MFENESLCDLKKINKHLNKIESMFINRLCFWSSHRKCYGIKRDGKIWIYNTLEGWSKQLGVSKSTIRRAIKSLKDNNLIFSKYLSPNKRNRTLYYAINYDGVGEYLSRISGNTCAKKSIKSEHINAHMDEHMYIIDNSKQNINKSYKSEKNLSNLVNEVHSDSTKPTTVQDMIKIWNEEFSSSKADLTKNLARFLVACFKTKFKSCLKEWKKYLKTLKTSAYLMGEKFKLSIWWVIKFVTIDRIRAGEFGVDKDKIEADPQELSERIRQHMDSLEETEACKKLRYKIMEKLPLSTYLSWFTRVNFVDNKDYHSENNGEIIIKTSNLFSYDYLNQKILPFIGLDCNLILDAE